VSLNDKADVYEAEFANLGIKQVLIDSSTIKAHPKLLVGGVWCIADIEYEFTEDKGASPWILASLKPIQLSQFDFDGYVAARKQFTTDEWIDLLIQSIGFNPQMFGRRNKLCQLVRLIPFCERNYNLIELGPKGTGKSHIYSEFSPHGILISGGEVTVPKLFVNNSSGKLGLVGYWDVVAFDEFAGKQKRVDKALVDIMKNYMANKSFSRGVETLGAEASMVFVGNTEHTVPYMLRHSDLFDPLPDKFHDSAFLDRIHYYIPGWEVDIIRGEMFSSGYGFVVDYLAEILRSLRSHDFHDRYQAHFTLSSDISTRDRDGIHKTFSGLMKILFPHGEATPAEIEEMLRFAIEGRKRVKDQLLRIDTTYAKVRFAYQDLAGKQQGVSTLEEDEYPGSYNRVVVPETATEAGDAAIDVQAPPAPEPALREQHLTWQENQRGLTFDNLFGPYLKDARQITITDPYIRMYHQLRNLMELMETLAKIKPVEDEVAVHLITGEDDFKGVQQKEQLQQIADACLAIGIRFTWEFDASGTIHARHIVTDHGWKILLDRGLDVFQRYEMNNSFEFANRMQQYRQCKAFEVTFIRNVKQ
jgi:ATP-dependent Lon protease